MKFAFITPGTGSYFCGVCMRDNALVAALKRQGHEAVMLPMYLPTMTDEASEAADMPVFFNGISVYLQQHFALFRHTPRWVDKVFEGKTLMNYAASKSGSTQGAGLGAMTLSMLRGEQGNQRKEVLRVAAWLQEHGPYDAVFLSTALQMGLARHLKATLGCPVVAFFQGEDGFLNSLDEPHRGDCWKELGQRSADIDRLVAPSRYFGNTMARQMAVDPARFQVMSNGISLDGYAVAEDEPEPPVIGYLARLCSVKGLGRLVDAFIELKQTGRFPDTRLIAAGTATKEDLAYVEEQKAKLANAGVGDAVAFRPNLTRDEKIDFLRTLTVFSVPAEYGEAFGLYVIEALAAGIPLVQPANGAFPELIEATGGGLLYEPGNASDLAAKLGDLLDNADMRHQLRTAGTTAVRERYTIDGMANGLQTLVTG